MENYVIIGNSGAAISAVRAIRSISTKDKITIISKENYPAYSPVSITYYLNDSISYKQLFFCDEKFYKLNKINTFLGIECVCIDTKNKKVVLENGNLIKYDKLLISSGASPIVPKIKNISFDDILTARTIIDAEKIKYTIFNSKKIVIIGAGLVGCQVANALINKNKKIYVIEKLPNIMPAILDFKAANIVQESMRNKGINLFLDDTVLEICEGKKNKKNKTFLLLNSGKKVEADIVIFAAGIIPNVEFLKGSDIEISKGILINSNMQTNIDEVFAAGDVAENLNAATGRTNINLTWLNAVRQGRIAGLNMAGKRISLNNNIRANISNIFGYYIISIGTVIKEDENFQEVVYCRNKYYKKLVFNNGFLVGLLIVSENKEVLQEIYAIINLIERNKIAYSDFCTNFYNQPSFFRLFAKEFYNLNRN